MSIKPGQYVIIRGYRSGCHCGEYISHNGMEVILDKARLIRSWEGKRLSLIDFGIIPGECVLSNPTQSPLIILDACAIIPTITEVEKFLRSQPYGLQNDNN